MNDTALIDEILGNAETVAVVGISNKPGRASFGVSAQMQRRGYRIVPVNPKIPEVLGEKSFPSLRSIPFPIDMVNVFRAAKYVPEIVDDTIAIGARYLWLQEGIVHPEATAHAEANGIRVVANRCFYKEYLRWHADRAER